MRILNVWASLTCIAFFVEFLNRGDYGWATFVLIGLFFGITTVLWGKNAPDRVVTLIARITEIKVK